MMVDLEFQRLYELANSLSGKIELTSDFKYKQVGCALLTEKGNIYTGVSLRTPNSTGFCAEQATISEMLKKDEYVIKKIVAVRRGKVVPPCGKCRQFILDMAEENQNTKVLVNETTVVEMKELMPYPFISNT